MIDFKVYLSSVITRSSFLVVKEWNCYTNLTLDEYTVSFFIIYFTLIASIVNEVKEFACFANFFSSVKISKVTLVNPDHVYFLFFSQFPEFIASFFSRLSWPSVGSPPAAPSRGNLPSFAGRPVQASYLPFFLFSFIFSQGIQVLGVHMFLIGWDWNGLIYAPRKSIS